jgi:hypothetical protein
MFDTAGVIWCCFHVSPPSLETATVTGTGLAFPRERLRKAPWQT